MRCNIDSQDSSRNLIEIYDNKAYNFISTNSQKAMIVLNLSDGSATHKIITNGISCSSNRSANILLMYPYLYIITV
jgi:hypothetical protein